MRESFGARLRQRREEQGIALVAIAERTKIKLSLLEALERDDVSNWPSGIYRRSYIRSYAQTAGLDPDVMVREFLEVHPDPDEILAAEAIAAAAETARTNGNGGPPTRLRYLVGSAIGSLARLRRSPVADPGLAQAAPVHESVPAVADFPVAADRLFDPQIETTSEAVVESAPVPVPATSKPELRASADPFPEPPQIHTTNAGAADSTPVNDRAPSDPDFVALAHLCTELGQVDDTSEVQPLLEQAARVLDATGLIVWIWDALAERLRPALAHGYSDKVLAQLPTVRPEEDNATAAAFRSARACVLNGHDHATGALAVPLLTSEGCAGVLAIELQHGRAPTRSLRAVATILAALLAQLAGSPRPAEVRRQAEALPAGGGLHEAGYSYPCATLTGDTSDTAPTRGQPH
jgi:transcriptional regulator with XRE-family HTH domain